MTDAQRISRIVALAGRIMGLHAKAKLAAEAAWASDDPFVDRLSGYTYWLHRAGHQQGRHRRLVYRALWAMIDLERAR